MRFAFFLPSLRIDNSGFTFEEFLRNLVAAVKISSPDNYPYPPYEHHYLNEKEGEKPFLRSNEMHMQWENYLSRYKVLPEEADLIRFHKAVSVDLDRAYAAPKTLALQSFASYVKKYVDHPVLRECLDLVAYYFLHKTASSITAAKGILLIDRCFFERSELPFEELLDMLRSDCHSNVHALPSLTLELETAPRFRRDRLYCVLSDPARPLACTNSYFVYFTRKSALANIAHIESFLSVDEAKLHGTDPAGWQKLRDDIMSSFNAKFTNARTEVSMT